MNEDDNRQLARAFQRAACLACQATWTNVYELSGYEGLEPAEASEEGVESRESGIGLGGKEP